MRGGVPKKERKRPIMDDDVLGLIVDHACSLRTAEWRRGSVSDEVFAHRLLQVALLCRHANRCLRLPETLWGRLLRRRLPHIAAFLPASTTCTTYFAQLRGARRSVVPNVPLSTRPERDREGRGLWTSARLRLGEETLFRTVPGTRLQGRPMVPEPAGTSHEHATRVLRRTHRDVTLEVFVTCGDDDTFCVARVPLGEPETVWERTGESSWSLGCVFARGGEGGGGGVVSRLGDRYAFDAFVHVPDTGPVSVTACYYGGADNTIASWRDAIAAWWEYAHG